MDSPPAPTPSITGWRFAGLAIALLGLPAVVAGFHWVIDSPTGSSIAIREGLIFALAGALLWILLRREGAELSSIGLHFHRPLRSLLLALPLTAVLFGVVVAILLIYGALGIAYGGGSALAPTLPVLLLTILRAGICEELFYRGYAISRIEALRGSKWIAAGISLAAFAGFHYRQGPAGVFLALVLGAVLTGYYLWKRDLLTAMAAHFLVDFVPNLLLPLLGAEGR